MKNILAATFLIIFPALAFAENECIPQGAVICTVSDAGLHIDVSTTLQMVRRIGYVPDSKDSRQHAVNAALGLANKMKDAGVCAFVVDNTSY